MARPQAFERELKIAGAGLEPVALQRLLVQTAKKALAEAQASGEAPEEYVRIVNGRVGAPEESVELPGPIIYQFQYLRQVAEYALAFAKERSPVLSGEFKRSWFAMVNGRHTTNFTNIPVDAELIITNDRPWARKVEVGAMKMRVPPGVVEDTRQAVMRRFGNIVTAQKRFISLSGAYVLRREGQRRDRTSGKQLMYPALVVNLRF